MVDISKLTSEDVDGFAMGLFYPWIILSLLLGVVCFVLNGVTFSFYKRKSKETLSLMYAALSFCDMMAGISAILNGAALCMILTDLQRFKNKKKMLFSKSYFLCVSAFATSITSHVSVFYNTVLMVVRTINMIFPFYKTRNDILKLSFVIYAVIWVIITIAHVILSFGDENMQWLILIPVIGSQFIKKLFNLTESEDNLNKENLRKANYSIWICVPYVIPAVICMACFIVQAHKLLRKTEVSSDVNKRITITIFYLSGVFFICNTAMFVTCIVWIALPANQKNFLRLCMAAHFSNNILGFVNSAMNPIILILRGRDLQRFARRLLGSSVSENAGVGSVVLSRTITAETEITLRSV